MAPSRATSKRARVADDSSSEDEPIAPKRTRTARTAAAAPAAAAAAAASSSSAADAPAPSKPTRKRAAKKLAAASDSEDEPLAAAPPPAKRGRKAAAVKDEPSSSAASSSSTAAAPKRRGRPPSASSSPASSPAPTTARGKGKAKAKAPAASAAVKKEEAANGDGDGDGGSGSDDDADGEFKWWKQENPLGDGRTKWTTLSHNGVYFPPAYVPHGVQMKYNGKPIKLGPAAEEVATFFAGVVGTTWAENPTFVSNFFEDWTDVIKRTEPATCPIKEFAKCDFTPLVDYLAAEKEKKKAMTKADKDAAKKAKQEIDDKYGWALVDGRKEKVGNFRVEPPGLFRGRGAHPKTGKLKKRLQPEDITINISKDSPVPAAPAGHKWKDVVHENEVTWLASWTENVNGQPKYVFLSAASSWKGMSDFKKFEKARELKKHVARIRREYTAMLKDRETEKRQLATALYFIDKLALRAGNEKGEDEADTVGCCSLRYEHVTLKEGNKVVFDFLGKDSIRYYNEVVVDAQVHKNLKLFKKDHSDGDDLFDRITTTSLNKHLTSLMPGLTAKVFRTYNASFTFQQELESTPADGSVADKELAYNRANRQVAVLCNHQRAVPPTHDAQLGKLKDKIRALKYQRREAKKLMLQLDPKLKKSRKDLTEPESDLDDEWIAEYLESEKVKDKEKLQKKLEKDNAEREAEGKPLLTLKELEDAAAKRAARDPTLEQLEKKVAKLGDQIHAAKTQLVDKDENKTTALSTSKINYIDPRITAAWCRKHDVPIEKMFPRTLREKFKWAMDAEADWEF
ncbi:hypothetical protein AMAG_07582 [Allomyces macrogynus ATCC 38327]|uniref:DNA topoisomerase I n=1 Tax=Allomyces macrogynus (strain ATCC 38327) TaxID=578462 RepID=A0A0L0SIL6_ALLM3|nr:hypothetical protein AMAG_07582 [Allomyces macrogynus ATCC 38327]|eukprot:KNE62356.1 hypothetical protein AMAG_07582 [Allomyces macrogynus ATCC 38327]